MQGYNSSYFKYKRLKTRSVKIGSIEIGNNAPIRVQTMTTTDTMDTQKTVDESIRCIEAGAELVRITAPSIKEAENLKPIKEAIRNAGFDTPIVADIHFTPNAAEAAAKIIEKVRVNPGNYIDKKKFATIEYSDEEYQDEIERIRKRFTPLIKICKENGTAMRIGTNHGSLSDRIMSRYGDTAIGMVESAMEFLRIARDEDYHQIVLSMKSSNPLVMVQAYRLLIVNMMEEFGECYPLHLGVTEAGDGEDGRIKSAIGIGSLLEDGIGDTIRVSLTEDPEFEIPVCRDLVERYQGLVDSDENDSSVILPYSPFEFNPRKTHSVLNIGEKNVPVVFADFMNAEKIESQNLKSIGYTYDEKLDKWHIGDAAADFIYIGKKQLDFKLPGTLKTIVDIDVWKESDGSFPLFMGNEFINAQKKSSVANFVSIDTSLDNTELLDQIKNDSTVVICIYSSSSLVMQEYRKFFVELMNRKISNPVVIAVESMHKTVDEQLIHFSVSAGGCFIDGLGNGIWLINDPEKLENKKVSGRTYLETKDNHQFLNNTSFSILQAVRMRISKTEYISCPSCGRTLFDLQETTAKIRNVTNHLKGLKIAVMGCIVNGPGEMADADFGYVGSGPGKITLYKGKEVIKRNINDDVAVDELISLLKENGVWIESTI